MTPYVAPITRNHRMVSNLPDAIRNTKKIYGKHRRIKPNIPAAWKHHVVEVDGRYPRAMTPSAITYIITYNS